MNRFGRTGALAAALAVAALGLGLAACGEEHESEVVEGEPIELGNLHLNVQLTRFLNPSDREDAEYLEGLPEPPPGKAYLGVFIEAENEGDEDVTLPTAEQMKVIDTTGQEYDPVESDSVFAFDFGEVAPARRGDPAARHRRGQRPDPGPGRALPGGSGRLGEPAARAGALRRRRRRRRRARYLTQGGCSASRPRPPSPALS